MRPWVNRRGDEAAAEPERGPDHGCGYEHEPRNTSHGIALLIDLADAARVWRRLTGEDELRPG
jgi:hypothetical protein